MADLKAATWNLKAGALLYYICRERDEGGVEPAGVNKQDIWPKFLVPGAILSIKRDVLNTQHGARSIENWVRNTQKRLRRIGRLPCFYWVFDRAASGLNPIVRFH